MRIIEVLQGLSMPVTNEEADLLSKFYDNSSVSRQDLNEREIVLANNLVVKDVLYRKNQNGQVTYYKKIPEQSTFV
jgi:hypothetical protein